MKEYIVPIYDDGRDDDSIFVGEIREKAMEVVRCKDCKRRKQDLFCIWSMPDDNWFCADGEKETES